MWTAKDFLHALNFMWFIGFASLEWEEKTSNLSLLSQLVIPNLKVKGNLNHTMYGIEKWPVLWHLLIWPNESRKQTDGDWKPQAYQAAVEHLNRNCTSIWQKRIWKTGWRHGRGIMVLWPMSKNKVDSHGVMKGKWPSSLQPRWKFGKPMHW